MSAPVDLSGLATYDPERDAPGVMEHRDRYNDGDYVKIEDVRALLAAAPACADPVVEKNAALLRSRSAVGIEKYGVTLGDSKAPLRDWLEHALLEMLDCANYMQKAMQAIDTAPAPATDIPWDEFPGWLIDHMEGETLTEESIQSELSSFLKNLEELGRWVRPSDSEDDEEESAPTPATPTIKDSLTVAPATPAASVDTAEFRDLALDYRLTDQRFISDAESEKSLSTLIAYIDADKARAVAAAREEGRNERDESTRAQKVANGGLSALVDHYKARAEKAEAALAAAPQQHAQAALSDATLHLIIEAVGQARNQRLSPVGTRLLVRRTVIEASQQPAAAPQQIIEAIKKLPLWGGHSGEGGGVYGDEQDGWLVDRDDVLACFPAAPSPVQREVKS